jgi:hypothetical protein
MKFTLNSVRKKLNAERVKKWRKNNPEKRRVQSARATKKCRVRLRAEDPERLKAVESRNTRVSWARLKAQVFLAYGSVCACCGESDDRFLAMDHIFNDGREHRKSIGGSGAFYKWLKKNGFPKDRFQLLCWNCNIGKSRHGGVCPHKIPRNTVLA